jgi:hypothetical protein
MTTVVSIRIADEYDILVDRSTPFGNPFSHLATECTSAIYRAASKYDAIRKHAQWLRQPEQTELVKRIERELPGKVLACHCGSNEIARGMCHAVTLARIADRRFR